MSVFLGLGITGIALLFLALIFDGILDSLFHGMLEGMFGGFMSLPVVAGFTAMLGFVGAIVLDTTGLGVVQAGAVGALAGVAAGWLTWRVSKTLMRDQTTSTPRSADLIGTTGSVVTAIPDGGYGEVMIRVAGQPVKLSAKCVMPVERGAEVWVETALSSTSVGVRPVER